MLVKNRPKFKYIIRPTKDDLHPQTLPAVHDQRNRRAHELLRGRCEKTAFPGRSLP